jgi:hypothetical protein
VAGEADDVIARMVAGGCRATQAIADDLLSAAVDAAPVEEGTLRGSGHIVWLVNDREYPADAFPAAAEEAIRLAVAGELRRFQAEIRFSTVYAAAQHEGIAVMTRGHTAWVWQAHNYPRGGGPKYLERPLLERAPRYEGVLARAIGSQFGPGIDTGVRFGPGAE